MAASGRPHDPLLWLRLAESCIAAAAAQLADGTSPRERPGASQLGGGASAREGPAAGASGVVEGGGGASESGGASADACAKALLEQAAQCLANALALANAPDDAGGTAVHNTGHSKEGTAAGADGGPGTLDTQAGLARAPADAAPQEAGAGLPEGGHGAAASPRTSSPAEGSLPDPAEGSLPDPAEGSLPDPAEGSLPDPAEGSLPDPAEGSAPDPAEGSLPDPGAAAAGVTGPAAAPAAADDRTEQSEPAQGAAAAAAMLCLGVRPRPWCFKTLHFLHRSGLLGAAPPYCQARGRAAFIDVAETPMAIISKPEHRRAAVGAGVALPDRGAAAAGTLAAAAAALLRASAHAASAWVGLRRGDPRGALEHARWLLQACPLALK